MTCGSCLKLQEISLTPGAEWKFPADSWTVIRLKTGVAYWLRAPTPRELFVSDVVVSACGGGAIRASRLGGVVLQAFSLQPELLGGVLTWTERNQLTVLASRADSGARCFPAEHEIARRFERLVALPHASELYDRCRLLEFWAGVLDPELRHVSVAPAADSDARERFRRLIGQIPEAELPDRSIDELASQLRCSPRHVSRLFREVFGVSLRTKQTELRLLKARRLLADSKEKVINVAMDSGYRHLGLFNAMFKKRFGVTPSEWRRSSAKTSRPRRGIRTNAGSTFLSLMFAFGLGALVAARSSAADSSTSTNAASAAAQSSTNGPVFEVRRYEIVGNSLLSQATLEGIFTNAIGPAVNLDQIRKVLSGLQLAYRERGYATVAVSLPQQQLTNATVRVKVTEGILTDITVTGNRYFSSNNVMRSLPSLRTNVVLNSQIFQQELDLANANRDRQIYPVIEPGEEPGTTALNLKVKDRLPLHGKFELNNYSTPGTPDLRMNLNAQYNNLWQLEHQVGLQYGFSPQELKQPPPDFFLDYPLIANYSAFYRLPLGSPQSVEEQVNANSVSFGYNEVTHQFRMPAATGYPDLTVYASRSTSDTGVKYGPRQIVAQTPLVTIVSQDSGQDLTLNSAAGTRLSVPIPPAGPVRVSLSGGFDLKRYKLTSYNTNNFTISAVITNSSGTEVIETSVASPAPTRLTEVDYLPFNIGMDFSIDDLYGNTSLSLGANMNWPNGLSDNADFERAAYSTKAKASYSTVTFALSREQKLFKDWSLLFRANGQLASGPLINNEQFALGGTAGVRGYQDGEAYGDEGWRILTDFRTPLVNIGNVDGTEPMWVRGYIFMDYGAAYRLDRSSLIDYVPQWGTGAGATATIGQHFDFRLMIGWPLLSTLQTTAGQPRVYFSVSAQF